MSETEHTGPLENGPWESDYVLIDESGDLLEYNTDLPDARERREELESEGYPYESVHVTRQTRRVVPDDVEGDEGRPPGQVVDELKDLSLAHPRAATQLLAGIKAAREGDVEIAAGSFQAAGESLAPEDVEELTTDPEDGDEWVLILTCWDGKGDFERPALERFNDRIVAEDIRHKYAENDGMHISEYSVIRREDIDSLPFPVSFDDCGEQHLDGDADE